MFQAADKIKIAGVLEMTMAELERHLVYQGATITPEIESAVLEYVAAYEQAESEDSIEIFPTESNEGLRLSSNSGGTKKHVTAIRGLLNIESGGGGYRLYRG